MTDYEQTAADFLAQHGIEFSAVYVDDACPPWGCKEHKEQRRGLLPCGGTHGGHYTITLSRHGSRLDFPFWNSYADEYGPADEVAVKLFGPRHCIDHADHWGNKPGKVRRCLPRRYGTSDRVMAIPPGPYSVLACLDSYCPATFDDFCAEYGFDSDSRRAFRSWEATRDLWLRQRAFFTDAELTELAEIN